MAHVWLGTAGWSYLPDWAGAFYPAGTTASDALARYFEAFRFVEVDSTFYAAPVASTLDRWAEIMPATGFRVSFKAPKALVQETGLRPPDVPFGHFCASLLDRFGERLARVVVQMPPGFIRNPTNEVSLRAFVRQWAEHVPLAIELRHPSWHVAPVAQILAELDVTWVSNDLRDVPDLDRAAHSTSRSVAYLRLIGQHDGIAKDRIQRPQDQARAWWVGQVVAMAEAGVRHIYIVVNNHYEGHAPGTLRTLAAEFRRVASPAVDLVESRGWPDGQVSLF